MTPISTSYDLVIRGGTIADGTGAPCFEGDVAVHEGRIAAVGPVAGHGAREISARSMLVAPGFVDIHTHYDAQAIWDSRLTPSSWHGVTTVVMGNCGVGFAPVREANRPRLIELMEGVEDIPNVCLSTGLDWQWESFPDFLNAVERRPHDVDICALLPHAALRVYVMGERALRLEASTPADNAAMRAIAAEAMRSGALGFSTSRTIGHRTLKGDPTPSLRAARDELESIAQGMADAGHGFMQGIADWEDGPDAEFDIFRDVVAATGRPALLSLIHRHGRPDAWRRVLERTREAAAAGLPIHTVVSPRPIGILFSLDGTQNPFSGTRTYAAMAHLSTPERVRRMHEPDVRRAILSEDPAEKSTFSLLSRLSWDQVFRFGDPPDYQPPAHASVAALAQRTGRTPQEVAYDWLLEQGGCALLFTPIANYDRHSMAACREMLADPRSLIGLGDAGAHVGFITDASFPTHLLTYWARQEQGPGFTLESLVHRQSCANARAVGLMDRGTIEPGMKADINLINLAELAIEPPRTAHDLPAGGRRLLQGARGYAMTLVSGVSTYENGQATGELPGRLVRGPRQAR